MNKFNQIACSFIASCFMFLVGSLLVWPSYTIEVFKSPSTPMNRPFTTLDESILGSISSVGALLSNVMTTFITDKLGRKLSAVVFTLPFIVSWIVISFTSSYTVLFSMLFLQGVGSGFVQTYVFIFIPEIAEDSIRGFLTGSPALGFALGSLSSYIIGGFMTYDNVLYFQIGSAFILLIFTLYIRETPFWYLQVCDDKGALDSLAFYRNLKIDSKDLINEFTNLKLKLDISGDDEFMECVGEKTEEEMTLKVSDTKLQSDISPWVTLWRNRSYRFALIICTYIMISSVFTGMMAIQVYAGPLFKEASEDISPTACSIMLAVVSIVGNVIAMGVCDKLGRRVLLITSSMGCAIGMITLGLLLQYKGSPNWIAPTIILMICLLYNFGCGTVPYIILAEAFPAEISGLTSVFIIEAAWVANFLLLLIFPPLVDLIGLQNVFFIFAIISFNTAFVSYWKLPETKGITIEEIQARFYKSKRRQSRLSRMSKCSAHFGHNISLGLNG